MKKVLLIIWLVVASSSALACNDCDTYWKNKYRHLRYEQKYRFKHEYREARHRGNLRLLRAKQSQRVRGRYSRRYSYRPAMYLYRGGTY